MEMLRRVEAGESPDIVYMQEFANAERDEEVEDGETE